MSGKFIALIAVSLIVNSTFSIRSAKAAGSPSRKAKTSNISDAKFALINWLIENENSKWNESEKDIVEEILINSIQALNAAGIDGQDVFEDYRFRRWNGEFAKDKDGKIAVVNHTDREIVLGDRVMLPENRFFIYHELGHIVNLRSNDRLSAGFHSETENIEGIVILHDWTTAMGYWMRGQSHVKRSEATADAFALWVIMNHLGQGAPTFHDTPESAQPDWIVALFDKVVRSAFAN